MQYCAILKVKFFSCTPFTPVAPPSLPPWPGSRHIVTPLFDFASESRLKADTQESGSVEMIPLATSSSVLLTSVIVTTPSGISASSSLSSVKSGIVAS